jgi:hypothetical protein
MADGRHSFNPHMDPPKRQRRVTVIAVVLLAVASIAAIIWRGPAILLDLSGLAMSMWCF